MDGICSTYGEIKDLYSVLVGKSEERRWDDNIETLRTGSFKLLKHPLPGFF